MSSHLRYTTLVILLVAGLCFVNREHKSFVCLYRATFGCRSKLKVRLYVAHNTKHDIAKGGGRTAQSNIRRDKVKLHRKNNSSPETRNVKLPPLSFEAIDRLAARLGSVVKERSLRLDGFLHTAPALQLTTLRSGAPPMMRDCKQERNRRVHCRSLVSLHRRTMVFARSRESCRGLPCMRSASTSAHRPDSAPK
jgi:hypothetical protein